LEQITINTTADKIYFSRAVNLIGSIKKIYQEEMPIIVWDKGLSRLQQRIIRSLGVEIRKIEPFSPHWSECYSWKFFVYKYSPGGVFLHLDAGNTVLEPLDFILEEAQRTGFFLVDQGQILETITPKEMHLRLNPMASLNSEVFAAGNIALNKNNSTISVMIDELYQASLVGECLGYSKVEAHRDRAGLGIIRDCALFRHDQTVLNLILRKHFAEPVLHSHRRFASVSRSADTIILNNRSLRYDHIVYASSNLPLSYAILGYCLALDIFYRALRLSKRFIRI
jgi:hypothetical protein